MPEVAEVSGRMAGDDSELSFGGIGQRRPVGKMHEQLDELLAARDQMEQLLRVIVEIGADLDLDSTLRRIVLAAKKLTSARYSAVAVRDPEGTLVAFVHEGIDDETGCRRFLKTDPLRFPEKCPTPGDGWRVIKVEDWADIRRLRRAEGVPIREIARRMEVSRNTVRAALASDRPPKYERVSRGSVVDGYEPQIRTLLIDWPRMPATVIAERINWPFSLSPLKKRLAVLRPEYAGVDPVDRFIYQPGEIAQCDLWFPKPPIPVGERPGASAAGPGDGARLLPLHLGENDPIPPGRGHLVGDVVADLGARQGPQDAGVGP